MSEYTPIDCATYSAFELAVIKASPLRISWRDNARQLHLGVVTPIDLLTRDRQEFLVVRDTAGGRLELRLDTIVKSEAL